jgi:hypothetical protein
MPRASPNNNVPNNVPVLLFSVLFSVRKVSVLLWALCGLAAATGWSQPPAGGRAMVTLLEQRVRERPSDAAAWRLLGRAWARQGDAARALECLQKAVQLDPRSAAAHCDLAETFLQVERPQEAAEHFAAAEQLAPQSEYADMARQRLPQLPVPRQSLVAPAGFEIESFERHDRFPDTAIQDPLFAPPGEAISDQRLHVRLEQGAVYNTNVTLAPTSRQFGAGDAESFQGIYNNHLEYLLANNELSRAGPTFSGYFNLNEGPFQDLNLQSYQPGLFLERSVFAESTILVPRVHYTYTLDEFAGHTFARRHALNTSLASFWDRGDATALYWTVDFTNFTDDGILPAATSRDGWTNTIGVHHTWPGPLPGVAALLVGSEVQLADTDGTDFSYRGVSVYSEAEIPLAQQLALILEGGWGFRDYHRFDLLPSRDENIWSAGAKLRRTLSESWSLVGVFRYDNFDSGNELFAAQRVVSGVLAVFSY